MRRLEFKRGKLTGTLKGEWNIYIEKLKRELPPPKNKKVIVRVQKCKSFGSSGLSKGTFILVVNERSDFAGKRDTLLHEWAHMLNWYRKKDDIHPGTWGVKYARCYRCLEEFISNEDFEDDEE